ncbi:MAG: DUF721 domain-containing protein, partial [Mucinivorans sp.]
MKRTEPQTIGELLSEYFAQRQLLGGVVEGRAVELWSDVVGPTVARYTEDVYIRQGVLHVTLSSSAVRSEVHMRRRYFI